MKMHGETIKISDKEFQHVAKSLMIFTKTQV